MKKGFIYLACPYTHADKSIMIERWSAVNRAAAKLMGNGEYVFSPISHTHPIAEAGQLPRDWNFWEGYDRIMLGNCDTLMVLKLPGWNISTGVQAEIKIAEEFGIPIEYMEPI